MDDFYCNALDGADIQISNKIENKRNFFTMVRSRSDNFDKSRIKSNSPLLKTRNVMSQSEYMTRFSSENIINIIQSQQKQPIVGFFEEFPTAVKQAPSIATSILENDDVVNVIIEAFSTFDDEEILIALSSAIISLTVTDISPLIDGGLMFTLSSLFENFPSLIINDLVEITANSKYAADSIVCCGILTQILDSLKENEESESTWIVLDGLSKLFQNLQSIESTECEQYITEMIPLLSKYQSIESINSVIKSLSGILKLSRQTFSYIFDSDVLSFFSSLVGQNTSNQDLIHNIIQFTSRLSVTDSQTEITKLIESGLVQSIITLLSDLNSISPENIAAIFGLLTNIFQGYPELILDLITLDFFETVSSILSDCPYEVFKEASNFSATVILFSPSSALSSIIGTGITNSIVEMLGCGLDQIVMKCLESLKRLFTITSSDQSFEYVSDIFLESAELVENLETLAADDNQSISTLAQYVLDVLDQHKTEQL